MQSDNHVLKKFFYPLCAYSTRVTVRYSCCELVKLVQCTSNKNDNKKKENCYLANIIMYVVYTRFTYHKFWPKKEVFFCLETMSTR